jgi:hypothetical protein
VNAVYGGLTENVIVWIDDPFQLFSRASRLIIIPLVIGIEHRVLTYYGIDLFRNELINNSKSRFEPLFSSKSAFYRFQQKSYDIMADYRFSILAIILGVAFGMNEWLALTRGVNWSQLTFLDIGFALFYIFWENIFYIGTISGVLLLFQLVITLRIIGVQDLQDLNIFKFENFDFSIPIEFDNRYEIVKYSIKRFKRQAKVVASFPIPFAIICIFIALLANFNFMGTAMIGYLQGEYLFGTIFPFFLQILGLNIILIAVSFALFIYPQNRLRNIIKERKEKTIFEFETFYEAKLMRWIQILDQTGVEAAEEKTRLEKEMKILSEKIDELNGINAWPFEAKQGLTVVGASLLPLITFLLSVLASVLFRVVLINVLS